MRQALPTESWLGSRRVSATERVRPWQFGLPSNEVHLWWACLDLEAAPLRDLYATLAPEEQSRTQRFHAAGDRNRFVAARGMLRELLGCYLGQEPAVIEFGFGVRGKPFLKDAPQPTIQFNVSHSHNLAVYAFAQSRAVGVDVERADERLVNESVIERHFSPDEIAQWRRLPADERTEGFYRCWTCKEAYVKARGEGMGVALASFSVTFDPEQGPVLHAHDEFRWKLLSFTPAVGFSGAIVVEGRDWQLRFCDRWSRSPY